MMQTIIFAEGDTVDSPSELTKLPQSQVDVNCCSCESRSVINSRLKVGLNMTQSD